jgi:Flp pilus assembly CpaE family ATPase
MEVELSDDFVVYADETMEDLREVDRMIDEIMEYNFDKEVME